MEPSAANESHPGQKRRRADSSEPAPLGASAISVIPSALENKLPSHRSSTASGSLGHAAEDYSQTYRPGAFLDNSELISQAKIVAGDLQANFDNDGSVKHVKTVLYSLELIKNREAAAVAQSQRAIEDSDSITEAAANTEIKNCVQALVAAQKTLADALAEQDAGFRRNLREEVARVTLQKKDPTDVLERSAALAGDVHFVQPPRMRCPVCRNTDETKFVSEYRSGDIVCTTCGTVVADHTVYDGDWTRSFEGEDSTSQVGPRPNALMSNSHNLRTSMSLTPGVSKARLQELRLLQEVIELNQSSYGNELADRRTREGYKDKQKVLAFEKLERCGARLQIPEGQVYRAKTIFAAFRDVRDKVTGFTETLAACLVASMEEAMWEAARQAQYVRTGSGRGSGGLVASAQQVKWTGHRRPQPPATASASASSSSSSSSSSSLSVPTSEPPPPSAADALAAARLRAAAASQQRAAKEKQLNILDVAAEGDSSDDDASDTEGTPGLARDAADDPFLRRTQLTRASLARPSVAESAAYHVTSGEFAEWTGTIEAAANVNPELEEREEYKAPS